MRERSSKEAFTLLELLVVLAILGVLASLLLSTLARARERGRTTQCLSQLRQLGLAMSLYADEARGLLPAAHAKVPWEGNSPPPWTRPLLTYYGSANVLCCPAYSRVYYRSDRKSVV